MHDDPHHDNDLGEMEARVRALETILVDKGLVDPAAVDAIIETYEHKVGPRNGAAVVARAWSDPVLCRAAARGRDGGHYLDGVRRSAGRAHGGRLQRPGRA